MSSVSDATQWAEALAEQAIPAGRASAVLVVDDEPGMRNFLHKALAPECALVEIADSAESAEALRRRYHFDLLIVDIRLPGRSGIEWLQELRSDDVTTDVIVMTAYADLETAVAALRSGASDFLLKPFRIEQMLTAVRLCLERRRMARENFLLRRELASHGIEGIVGTSAAMSEVCAVVHRVAPTASTVLIEGETGTGKELVASAVHYWSERREKLFVAQNCAAMPENLLESELFGHEKGAFTGATDDKKGLFELADGGTLFLDEVGEMPLALQAKLLRVLQEGEVRPVGSNRTKRVDVRIVAATNRDLEKEVAEGRFREDLFYRLNVFPLRLPPLRERREDVPLLAGHFLKRYAEEFGRQVSGISQQAMEQLQAYEWPGNVRELENEVQRLIIQVGDEEFVQPQHLSPKIRKAEAVVGRFKPNKGTLKEMVEQVEKQILAEALAEHDNNKTATAKTLGITREGLHKKLKGYGMT